MSDDRRLHDVLGQIARLAQGAMYGESGGGEPDEDYGEEEPARGGKKGKSPGCTLRSLPDRLLIKAAETATRVNPVNAPVVAAAPGGAAPLDPLQIAVLTSKYWGATARRLTVSFLDSPSAALRRKIVEHLNAWNRTAGISFVETGGTGNVRISRSDPRGGFWSYLGTDILHIASNQPTMNLEGFTVNTSEAEYKRVVRHEAGHTLGFPHEHMRRALVNRIDPEKAYRWFWENHRWPRWMVDQQVLTPLDERSLMSTPADQTSIMCYQLPGAITRDGRPIPGGSDINATDYAFAGRIYPKPGRAAKATEYAPSADEAEGPAEEDEGMYLEEPMALAD